MNTVISAGSRVRVQVYRSGYHKRNMTGICCGWTPGGMVKVREDGQTGIKAYNADHVRLIK